MISLDVVKFITALHTSSERVTNAFLEIQLPHVHAHLISGMVVGSEVIKKDRYFYQALIDSSLVHVVVVSGYNINLVLKGIESVFKLKYNLKSLIFLLCCLVCYMVMCGLTAPVVRAGIMGFLSYFARFSGRATSTLYVFLLTMVLMLTLNFGYFTSLSFWLSSGATLGLIIFAEPINNSLLRFIPEVKCDCPILSRAKELGVFLAGEMATTLAASLIVTPIIAFNFERLNVLSPIYNVLSLWLVPLITILGFAYVVLGLLIGDLSYIFAWVIYVPTTLFIKLVTVFNKIPFGNLNVSANISATVIYYAILLIFAIKQIFKAKNAP